MFQTILFLMASLFLSLSGEEVTDPRYPAVSPDGSEMVYCWRGALWHAPVSGGASRCLTPGRGPVSSPSFSPGGDMIAFTSHATGGGDVYVMPGRGGVATRLTYHGGEDIVMGWNGERVLFTSSREGGDNWLWSVDAEGGTPTLDLPASVRNICFLPEGLVFERGFTPWWRRHYSGSASSSLWLFDGGSCEPVDHREKDQRWPMADGSEGLFYVMEDADGIDRFFSPGGIPLSGPVQGGITFPSVSADGSVVVFESAGKLFRASTADMTPEGIFLPALVDLPFPGEELFFAGVYTSDFSVDPAGSFMVMEAEGEIYAAPLNDDGLGDALRITRTSALESRPRISPDGTRVLFQREEDGEVRLVMGRVIQEDDEPIRIVCREINTGVDVSTYPEWAPSGDFSFLDGEGRLHVMDTSEETSRLVCDNTGVLHHSWSPDSRWIAFSTMVEAHREDVFVVRAAGGTAVNLSRHPNDDFQPMWPSDGRRLIWASRTDEGDYSIVQAWFSREDWEADTDEREELLDDPLARVKVETDGLYMRTEELCTVEGYYDFYGMPPGGRMFYFPATDQSGQKDLWSVDWKGENLIRESFGDHSPERIQPTDTDTSGEVYYLSYGASIRSASGELLSWTGRCSRFIHELQRQKFTSAWRMLRDNFYDPGMHGVDWNEMRSRYEERAAAALVNSEFNDVVRRMLGELSASHLGIYGPWQYIRTAYTGETGMITSNGWRGGGIMVDSVLPMSPAYLEGIRPGDIITGIDGIPVGPNNNFYAPLRNATDREIEIDYTRNGEPATARLTPVSQWNIWRLTYREWLASNRRVVSRLSQDRVGYLHIPSMDLESVGDFRRDLYAEGLGRDAMIIDVRGNGGGSTHDQIISSLARDIYARSRDRSGRSTVEPLGVYQKPLVLLINETCYSDAEIFPAAWKELGLGPIVGNTTYGAVIGTVDVELADGTGFRLPGTGWYTLSGENLENTGVSPDIFVVELPCDAGEGIDRQLQEAVSRAVELID